MKTNDILSYMTRSISKCKMNMICKIFHVISCEIFVHVASNKILNYSMNKRIIEKHWAISFKYIRFSIT